MIGMMQRLWSDESGQGLPEYALLVAAVVVMVVTAASLFTTHVEDLFTRIGTYITANAKV